MALYPDVRRGAYHQYHSSLKLFLAAGGNPVVAYDLNIPRSTVASWKRTDFTKLITTPVTDSALDDFRLYQKFIDDRVGQKLFQTYSHVSETFHIILRKIKNSKDIFNKSKSMILETIENVRLVIGIQNALKLFKLSRRKYDMWVKNISCSSSPIGLCVRQYPNQLLQSEVDAFKRFFLGFEFSKWPLNSIYYEGVRKGLLTFSLSTFYKYARDLGFSHPVPDSRRANHKIGIRAAGPNKIWHMDITIFKPIDHVKVYIYLVVDNYSRFILGWRASLVHSASLCSEHWSRLTRNFGDPRSGDTIQVLVDGGPENKPLPLEPNLIPIKMVIAQKDILFSNSMIEAINKILKYRYLFTQDLANYPAVIEHLRKSIPEFNFIRPYGPLQGLTPAEAFSEIAPDPSRFKKHFHKIQEQRYQTNRTDLCPICKD